MNDPVEDAINKRNYRPGGTMTAQDGAQYRITRINNPGAGASETLTLERAVPRLKGKAAKKAAKRARHQQRTKEKTMGAEAPNRSLEVAGIAGQHPEAFRGPAAEADDRKRKLLLETIIPTLNIIDGGNWGYLTKTDQGDKIPADFMVWRPTMEGFDVLTDTGPMWGADGVVRSDKWKWTAAGTAAQPPITPGHNPPSPNPVPVGGISSEELDAQLSRLGETLLRAIDGTDGNNERRYKDLVANHKATQAAIVQLPTVWTGEVKVPFIGTVKIAIQPAPKS